MHSNDKLKGVTVTIRMETKYNFSENKPYQIMIWLISLSRIATDPFNHHVPARNEVPDHLGAFKLVRS